MPDSSVITADDFEKRLLAWALPYLPSVKTIYLIKSLLPYIFLPIAPGVIQVELQRQGFLYPGTGDFVVPSMQVLFSMAVMAWLALAFNRKSKAQAFLKMSCVSKKVFHKGKWMSVEQYLSDFHNIVVSHGLTPEESVDWMRQSQEWLRAEELKLDSREDLASIES